MSIDGHIVSFSIYGQPMLRIAKTLPHEGLSCDTKRIRTANRKARSITSEQTVRRAPARSAFLRCTTTQGAHAMTCLSRSQQVLRRLWRNTPLECCGDRHLVSVRCRAGIATSVTIAHAQVSMRWRKPLVRGVSPTVGHLCATWLLHMHWSRRGFSVDTGLFMPS